MKKFLLSIGCLVFVSLLGVFLRSQVKQVTASDGGWVDTSSCTVTQCGAVDGTKTQEKRTTREVCDNACPTETFTTSRLVCPEGFSAHGQTCRKWIETTYECPSSDLLYLFSQQGNRTCSRTFRILGHNITRWAFSVIDELGHYEYANKVTQTFGPIDVVYGEKSEDPNKCHKPTGVSLGVPSWAMSEFETSLPQHQDFVQVNCHEVTDVEPRTVACQIPAEEVIACEVDVCPNIPEMQTTLPENHHFDTIGETRVCVPDEETPEPTSTPVPTATPNPDAGRHSKTGISDPVCVNNNFDAIMFLYQDGQPVSGVTVKFVYRNEAKFAKTEANGRAGVAYGYVDDSDVFFYPEDGYPSQIQKVIVSDSCKTPVVVNTPPTTGSVLGASTLASAGVVEETLVNMVGLLGAGLTAAGSILYGKKKHI